jgi:hypothetical protein
VYEQYINKELRADWFVRFAISGTMVAVFAFGAVYAIWGLPSLEGAITWTFFGKDPNNSGSFFFNASSLFANPLQWSAGFFQTVSKLWFVLVPAAVLVCMRWLENEKWLKSPVGISFLLAVLLLIPVVARPHPYYWILPSPWIVSLAVLGLEQIRTALAHI